MKIQSNNNSICRAACSSVIFMAYFLPWIDITFSGTHVFSISLIEVITQTEKTARAFSELFIYAFTPINYHLYFLFIIPLLSAMDIVLQLIRNRPVFSFYATILPTGMACSLILYLNQNTFDILKVAGIGTVIIIIAGIVSITSSWTYIGRNYHKYKNFVAFLIVWIILSIIFAIIQDVFIWDKLSDIGYENDPDSIMPKILCIQYIIFIFSCVGIMHVPFVIYAWILALVSKKSRRINVGKETIHESLPDNKFHKVPHLTCPCCQRDIAKDINFCSYCGTDLNKIINDKHEEKYFLKKRETKKDNLKYAPPQYRKE